MSLSTSFSLFPSLPPELRRRIWELSPQSREVRLFLSKGTWRSRTKTPPELHTCHEARVTLANLYTQAFRVPTADIRSYLWIDFTIDTLRIDQTLLSLVVALPLASDIHLLAVDCTDNEAFWPMFPSPIRANSDSSHIRSLCNLEKLTLLYMEDQNYTAPDRGWRDEFTDVFASYYHTCSPVPFDARAIHPRLPEMGEINRNNFARLDREYRKSLSKALGPGAPEFSDSEDDVDGPKRWLRWRHDGCDCLEKRKSSSDMET